jgi:hypothetical protein
VSRDEIYLNAILTGDTSNLPEPISRVDKYLYQIAIKNAISSSLDNILQPSKTYQLGVLTSDITLTLPEATISDIEVDFAIADTTYNINCDYLQLNVVENTYYQVIFSYDKSLNTWFSSVVSSDYISTTTAEVLTDET